MGGPTPLDAWCLSLLMLAACRLTLEASFVLWLDAFAVEVSQPGLCYNWFSHSFSSIISTKSLNSSTGSCCDSSQILTFVKRIFLSFLNFFLSLFISFLVFSICYVFYILVPAGPAIFAFNALWRCWTRAASCHDWRCPGPAFWGWPIDFRTRQSYNKIRRYYSRI